MTKHIAILRGINVGGKRKIKMADLRELFERLGAEAVSTYIQSGNVFFYLPEGETAKAFAEQVAQAIAIDYGFEVPVLIRSRADLEQAVKANPFLKEDLEESQLHLTFLGEAPAAEALDGLEEDLHAPDRFVIQGKNVFVYCAGKYHSSKLSNRFFERKLSVQATTRNWRTVQKLLEKSAE